MTLHPLARVPGPYLAAATPIPRVYALLTGNTAHWTAALHERYGEVVRLAPGEVSFISETAWKEIYAYHNGRPAWIKAERGPPFPNNVEPIITTSDVAHTRQRKLLAHAFSERALKEQEGIIVSYVDLLVEKLREQVKLGQNPVDMVNWYNHTTFDVIGDFTYGESFHSLEKGDYHPWVWSIYHGVKALVLMGAMKDLLPFNSLTKLLIPSSMKNLGNANFTYSRDKIQERLDKGATGHPDFMSYVLKYNDEKGMSRDEIDSTFSTLALAGSETTATLLSGCTYYLLKNPEVYAKLTHEILAAFSNEAEIRIDSTNRLPYLKAVLEESLRVYPPVPSALSRVVAPPGDTISGYFIPGGTMVGIPQHTAYHSSRNFTAPDAFIPERWLPEHVGEYAGDRKSAFMPFSAGNWNCIGKNLAYAEMRLVVARMVWEFEMELADKGENWVDQRMYGLWDKKPLMVKLSPRSK